MKRKMLPMKTREVIIAKEPVAVTRKKENTAAIMNLRVAQRKKVAMVHGVSHRTMNMRGGPPGADSPEKPERNSAATVMRSPGTR